MKNKKDKTERLQRDKTRLLTAKGWPKRDFHKEQLRQEDSGVMLQNAEGKYLLRFYTLKNYLSRGT